LGEKKQANEVIKARSGEYCALNVKVEDERFVSLRSVISFGFLFLLLGAYAHLFRRFRMCCARLGVFYGLVEFEHLLKFN